MIASITVQTARFSVDFARPINISLPIARDQSNPNAYYLPEAQFVPFRAGSFVGSIELGGPCNCEVVTLAPHGNGTHTECVGHISREAVFIADVLQAFISIARVVSIEPQQVGNDWLVRKSDVEHALQGFSGECLVLRTLPNVLSKEHREWSGTNPAYCEQGVGTVLREHGIRHFLLDLPSVDREEDAGALHVHHEFWNYPEAPRMDATITEMIYVPDTVVDGEYLLQFATLGLESDASPSQIFLYELRAES